jgi:hypothetical protein
MDDRPQYLSLRLLAEQQANRLHSDAYTAGAALFGRHGDVRRQSSQLK